MLTIYQLKEWLRIDGEDEDDTLSSLIATAEYITKSETGIAFEDVRDNEKALAMYNTYLKIVINDLYENRSGSAKISPLRISLSKQLQVFSNG